MAVIRTTLEEFFDGHVLLSKFFAREGSKAGRFAANLPELVATFMAKMGSGDFDASRKLLGKSWHPPRRIPTECSENICKVTWLDEWGHTDIAGQES